MPAATAALTATELASLEPADRTSDEWRMWKREIEAAIQAENAGPTAAPPAPPPPTAAPPAPAAPSQPAAPAAEPVRYVYTPRKIMTPDEFITQICVNDPRGALAFAAYANSAAGMASAVQVAYTSYLLLVSPKFSADYAAKMKKGLVPKQVLPDPYEVDRLYSLATGA